jgi:hypothetical protein
MRPIPAVLVPALLASFVAGAAAQPSPLSGGLFAFPASNPSPATASSAALGLADRWLGEIPFDNPALAARRTGGASGILHRVSRQDLRADNRQYDEQPLFVDPAAAWVELPAGPVRLSAYGWLPVLRREDNSFLRGEPGGPVAPAVVSSTTEAREVRAGLAAAAGSGAVTVGVAGEYTFRRERYSVTEESGAPESGTREIEFDGGGVGGQMGLRLDLPRNALGEISLGIAARYLPALALDGGRREDLVFLGTSSAPVEVERESGWEGGATVADRVSPALRVVAGAGARTARDWDSFGVTSGEAWSIAAGLEYRDPAEPWTARFGIGREGEAGSATPRTTVVGLGFGWWWDRMLLEAGVLHRSLAGEGAPTSSDDRIVLTLRQEF